MVDITEISAVVAAAGVLVGVVYYMLDLRHQARISARAFLLSLYIHTCKTNKIVIARPY
jgi:xanthosine utilization system XapX-like protein